MHSTTLNALSTWKKFYFCFSFVFLTPFHLLSFSLPASFFFLIWKIYLPLSIIYPYFNLYVSSFSHTKKHVILKLMCLIHLRLWSPYLPMPQFDYSLQQSSTPLYVNTTFSSFIYLLWVYRMLPRFSYELCCFKCRYASITLIWSF